MKPQKHIFDAVWGWETLREAKWAGGGRDPPLCRHKRPQDFPFWLIVSPPPPLSPCSHHKRRELSWLHVIPPPFFKSPQKIGSRREKWQERNLIETQKLNSQVFPWDKILFLGGVSLCLGTVLRKNYPFYFLSNRHVCSQRLWNPIPS